MTSTAVSSISKFSPTLPIDAEIEIASYLADKEQAVYARVCKRTKEAVYVRFLPLHLAARSLINAISQSTSVTVTISMRPQPPFPFYLQDASPAINQERLHNYYLWSEEAKRNKRACVKIVLKALQPENVQTTPAYVGYSSETYEFGNVEIMLGTAQRISLGIKKLTS
ncbi:MAG: hypothetical protein HYX48_00970 [Chlamydiales bacterium]|nr:hypothetical protein [Chlamydiales bacterium]